MLRRGEEWESEIRKALKQVVMEFSQREDVDVDWSLVSDSKSIDDSINNIAGQMYHLRDILHFRPQLKKLMKKEIARAKKLSKRKK